MKKLVIGGGVALFLLLGMFFWLVAGASPENAPQEVIEVELPDTYEK